MSDIETRLRRTILKALDRESSADTFRGENLIEELGISSVDALEILVWVEDEFRITIHDEDLNQGLVSSIASLTAYVRARLEAPVAA